MTDEVFSDNLDEASKADTEAAAAVEALPAEGEAVQAVAADQATDEQAQSEQDAPEEQTAETTEDEDTEQDAGAKAVEEFSKSLRTLEGKWYVLHTYSGYEKRVKTNVESRVASFGMEDKIFQVEVPMEEVEKHTEKGKKVITRVRVPGYVLIRMLPDENARRIVRETEGVTGFVGSGTKPTPLTEDEVLQLGVEKREIVVNYAVGDTVRIADGPLTSFTGVVEALDPEKNKVRVAVSMFGRETPVELELDQVEVLS